MILLLGLLGCAPEPPEPIVVAPRTDIPTRAGLYRITWAPKPDPIPLSELFVVEARVVDATTGRPVEDATVRIDASMPQHGHGMATRPENDPGQCIPAAPADAAAAPPAAADPAAAPPAAADPAAAPPAAADPAAAPPTCSHPEGRYRTEGMKFHMPGAWLLTFEVVGPAGTDRLDLPVEL